MILILEIIRDYKRLFSDIINADSMKDAKEKRNKLFYLNSNVSNSIHELASNLIIPKFKKLTNYFTNQKIAIPSNKIEDCLLKTSKNPKKNYLNI